jgi:hypothetical protein
MRTGNTVFVIVIAVFACLLFCTPAFACYNWNGFPMQGEEHPLYHNGTVANGTVIGGVYYDAGHGETGEGPIDVGPYTQTFSVPAYDKVQFAHLYVLHVWASTESYHGWVNTSFNDDHSLGNITLLGDDDVGPGCNKQVWSSGHGVYVVRYNVTSLVTTGTNTASAVTGKLKGSFDGRVLAIGLIVVYEKEGMDKTRYWIVQGHDTLTYATSGHPAKDYGYAYFNGTIDPNEWKNAVFYSLWTVGDTGDTDTLWFNGDDKEHELCVGCTNYEQGTYFDFKKIEIKNDTVNLLTTCGNYARYWRDGDPYVHWMNAVLVLSKESKPDLIVEKIEEPVLPYYNYTLAVVENHTYNVNATIKNIGTGAANELKVALHAGGNLLNTQQAPSLDAGASKEVQFSWTPTAAGNYTLKVTADATNQINESDETNNNLSKVIDVLPEVEPDLAIAPKDIKFLPAFAWHAANNKTTIQVNVTNNGTKDAHNFNVRLFVNSTGINNTQLSVAAKAVKGTSFVYDAPKGGPYAVKLVLNADGAESNETNNKASRLLKVIEVRIRSTHHYGDTSIYNAIESNWTDVEMFDVTKLVPENATPLDVLNSVAHVRTFSANPVYEIDGIEQDPKGPIYWRLYMNGRYMAGDYRQYSKYPLREGEAMQWEFQKNIYSATESFTPPCTVQSYNDLYPEPFTHGYWHSVWNTTVVYPAESPEYLSIANKISNKLVSRGVPHERIDIDTDSNVTSAEKRKTNNLILLGNYTANDIIETINPFHEYFGMVVYFDEGKMIDDYDNAGYDCGSVVQAFDNPYDDGYLGTNYSWNFPGPVIFMASGLIDSDAKDAAELLINRTDELNMFWIIKEPSATGFFDTGCGTYPSISGVHKGNFTPKCDIEVQHIYTYPCTGTGGHGERVIFYDGTAEIINASCEGYPGDYHNISVSPSVMLSRNKEYRYKIITGSYPQIIHNQTLTNEYGTINCTEFIDANGKRYDDWIPAIKLF